MQPSRKVKRIHTYKIGEAVNDFGHRPGEVAAVIMHPDRRDTAYMLVVSDDGNYNVYRGLTDCNSGLSLARDVPEKVMRQFAEVILGGSPPAPPSREIEREPYVSEKKSEVTEAPYFDFV